MTAFAGPGREELRHAYTDALRKRAAGTILTALEAMITDVIELHPEFHSLIEAPAGVATEPAGADPAHNPYLHMGLHIAVREQLSIDRPPGIRDLQARLQATHLDSHAAEHELMHALGETLRRAQLTGRPPQERDYLALLRSRLSRQD